MSDAKASPSETVVVLGASARPERFANRAQRRLHAAGHRVLPVNPALDRVEGIPVVRLDALVAARTPVDTVTVYLRGDRLAPLMDRLVRLAPRRVLLNPGADDPDTVVALREQGLRVQCDCTLVLLDQGTFSAHRAH
jgi:predicted CoA-binding protein